MLRKFIAVFLWVMLIASVSYAETVIYDGSNIAPFKGRTNADVIAKYSEAKAAGGTYRNTDSTTWYSEPASVVAPYNAGVLTQDTHNAMTAMTNFYKWLAGVQPMSIDSVHSDSLQAGALIRNFDFGHAVSSTNKPEDMSQELWDYGASAGHNILAMGNTPRDSITRWLNEGYLTSKGEWDYGGNRAYLGHRMMLISGYTPSMQFGYSGEVAIGGIAGGHGEVRPRFEGAFAAFPPPGPMPRRKINYYEAAWHVEVNTDVLTIPDRDNVVVTVTDMSTGSSYECTTANGKIGPRFAEDMISFVQPVNALQNGRYSDIDTYYSGDYRVDVSGLRDAATGNDARITYTVSFMELPPEVTTSSPFTFSLGEQRMWAIFVEGSNASTDFTVNGTLPEGLSIRKASMLEYWGLEGTMTTPGTYTFSVTFTNEYGSDTAQFTVIAEAEKPKILHEVIDSIKAPDGTFASVDIEYAGYVNTSGSRPITWSIQSGRLPNGLTMNQSSSGNISITGTPTEEGVFTFTLRAENTAGYDEKTYTLTSRRVKPVIDSSRTTLARGELNSTLGYWSRAQAEGSNTITWSLVDGKMPEGLTLSPDGTITGTPTEEGTFTFTLRAENDLGYDTGTFTITIEAGKPRINNMTLDNLNTGENCYINFYADGSKPFTWSVAGGSIPPGTIFGNDNLSGVNGLLSGTPTTPGSYTFTLKAENSAGSDTKTFTLTVEGTAITDTPTSNVTPDVPTNDTPTSNVTPDVPSNDTPTSNVTPDVPSDSPTNTGTPDSPANTPTNTETPSVPGSTSGTSAFNADTIRAMLGKDSSVPVSTLYVPVNRQDASYYDAEAVLQEIRVATTGIYLIENIPLSYTLTAGAYLYWHHSVNELYYEDNADCVFLDNYGRRIVSPITSSISSLNAAVYLEAGKYYRPAITAWYSENDYGQQGYEVNPRDAETGRSKGGGGCNSVFAGMSAVVAVIFLKRRK